MNNTRNDQNLTLNQLDKIFREIAANHAQINAYGEGESAEISTTTIRNYPLFWCEILPGTLNYQTDQYNYRFYVMDLVNNDNNNLLEVQSDARSVLKDIILLLRDYYDLLATFSMQITPFVDALPDKVAGFYLDVHIEIPFSLGFCDVPEKVVYNLIDNDSIDLDDSDTQPIDVNNKFFN